MMNDPFQHYSAALSSVQIVTDVLAVNEPTEDELGLLRRNGQHLAIMLERLIATGYDLEPIQSAVEAVNASNPGLLVEVPQEPLTVSMAQARVVLAHAGLLQGVDAKLDALPEPDRTTAKIAWEYSASMSEDSEFVKSLGLALELSDEQISDLFRQAAKIKF